MTTPATGFLDDTALYASAQQRWEQMWSQIDPLLRTSEGWIFPWLSNPFCDGNPIFSAVSYSQGRGIRICQFVPQRREEEFFSWADTFGEKPDEIRELVISCSLSNANLHRSRRMIEEWIRGTVTASPFEPAMEADGLSVFPVPTSFGTIAA